MSSVITTRQTFERRLGQVRQCRVWQRMVRVGSACALLLLVGLCGCQPEMTNQLRVDTMKPSAFAFETPEHRVPPPGTIARGQVWEETPVTTGREDGEVFPRIPIPVNAALLERGREQFGIFCQQCHGPAGNGDGMVVQRGFPPPPSYHIERLRDAPDGALFVTISEGVGKMPPLGKRIPIEDRWALVAYVRALQLSQNAPAQDLPAPDRQQLDTLPQDLGEPAVQVP